MKTRVISAVIAVALLALIFVIWRLNGLYALSFAAAAMATYEYSRLTLGRLQTPAHIRVAFLVLALGVLAMTATTETLALPAVAIASVFFLTMSLLTVRSAEELTGVLQVQSAGVFGFIYCGVFGGLAIRLLHFENGAVWLFGLLAIVFSGDTFAYLTGRLLGRTKLLEPVSPKKTMEGAAGGLVGSMIAGALLGIFFLNEYPLGSMVLMALATGAFAQVGDLFESLLKRVAEVKDSGTIMPGHGGMLDRLDGILFAAPVFYVLAKFLA
jgi:phosphatidate cytidylyltransferase